MHQCDGVRVDKEGKPYPCPLKLRTEGQRYCGRCQLAAELGVLAVRCGWCGFPIADGEPTEPRSSTLFQHEPHPLHVKCADEFDNAGG